MGFTGRPVMAMSSSSVAPMKKRRCVRRTLPMLKPRHLLLETPRPQPSLLLMMLTHLTGCQMTVMAVAPLIGCKVIVVMVEMRLGALGCHTKKGCLQEVGFEEFKNNDESALLHHKFFCKEE
jgi:hypothetical protein